MPKLKILSGKELIKLLRHIGFEIESQKGSHIKFKRILKTESQTLTIPNHTELDKGTLKAIYRQASRYISLDELDKIFYF